MSKHPPAVDTEAIRAAERQRLAQEVEKLRESFRMKCQTEPLDAVLALLRDDGT